MTAPSRHTQAVSATLRWHSWGLVIAVAVALTAHAPVLRNSFVNWDDPANILDNRFIRSWSWTNLRWMWTTHHLGVYEPLSWMLKGAIYSVGGLNPRLFHGVSLALHAVNAALFYLVTRKFLKTANRWVGSGEQAQAPPIGPSVTLCACIAAVIFATHPLRVECVAWASGQPYLLAACFALIATGAYLRAAEMPRRLNRWFIVSVGCYVCSLLSKSIAVPLPLVLFLLDVYPLGRIRFGPGSFPGWWRPILCEKIPYLAAAALFAAIAFSTPTISVTSGSVLGISQRLAIAAYGSSFYVLKTVWPTGLSPIYLLPARIDWSGLFVLAGLFAATVTIACCTLARKWPAIPAAWFAYLILATPSLGVVRHGDQLAADRYSYLACMSFAAFGGMLIMRFRKFAPAITAMLVVALIAVSWRQTAHWRDSDGLWTHALAVDNRNWVALNNLANDYLDEGRLAEAEQLVDRALGIRHDYPDALYTRGRIRLRNGDLNDAIRCFRQAIALVPFHAAAVDLGIALQRAGRREEALDVFRSALQADPTNEALSNNLAVLYNEVGHHDGAERMLVDTIRRNPLNAQLYFNLGVTYAAMGRWAEAGQAYRRALELDPQYPRARNRLAAALVELHKPEDAVAEFAEIVTTRPDSADARTDLALALLHAGRDADAVSELEAARRLRPDDLRVTNQLAWTLATSGDDRVRDPKRALGLAAALCERVRYGNVEALDTYAAALAAVGRFDEAVQAGEKAIQLARSGRGPERVRAIQTRMEGYRARRPYREDGSRR